jgi:peroxiredoxin
VAVVVIALAVLWPVPARPGDDPVSALDLTRATPARPARDFQVPTPDHGTLRLADFKGQVVLLNFWATWCKPCEEEMPGMERLHRKFRGRGLAILAISMDSDGAAAVRPFVQKHRLTFPVGLDPKMTMSAPYGIWALPVTFVIDRGGRRVLVANGPRRWDSPAAEALVEAMLKEAGAS